MARSVVHQMPYFGFAHRLDVNGEDVEILSHQPVVWVGLAPVGQSVPAADHPVFPAIVDTGCNTTFIISPTKLAKWCKVDWRDIPFHHGVELKHQGVPVPHRRANLWIYANRKGTLEVNRKRSPVLLELDLGIAVFGDGVQVGVRETTRLIAPRLPLVGMQALAAADLSLAVDTARKDLTIRQNEAPAF